MPKSVTIEPNKEGKTNRVRAEHSLESLFNPICYVFFGEIVKGRVEILENICG